MKAYKGPYKGMSPRQIIRAMIEKYPGRFYATHPTPGNQRPRPKYPDPTKVTHTFSGVLQRGTRIWAFDTEQERDAFVTLWPLAEKAEEPSA